MAGRRAAAEQGRFAYWWRSHLDRVPNHYIRGPVRFWSREGSDENVLQALAERRFYDLPRVRIPAVERQRQLAADLQAALTHLRTVCDSYWDQNWRREHRGSGHYPEHVLWEAVHGYLDLRDAQDQAGPSSPP